MITMGEGYREYHIFTHSQEDIDKWGWSNFYLNNEENLNNGVEGDFDWDVHEITKTYDDAVDVIMKGNKLDPIAYGVIWEYQYLGDEEDYDEGNYTDNYTVIINSRPRATINNDKLFNDIILNYIREG